MPEVLWLVAIIALAIVMLIALGAVRLRLMRRYKEPLQYVGPGGRKLKKAKRK